MANHIQALLTRELLALWPMAAFSLGIVSTSTRRRGKPLRSPYIILGGHVSMHCCRSPEFSQAPEYVLSIGTTAYLESPNAPRADHTLYIELFSKPNVTRRHARLIWWLWPLFVNYPEILPKYITYWTYRYTKLVVVSGHTCPA
jgi:hypothetical protein